jgi:ABC-2 type transport system permease protein
VSLSGILLRQERAVILGWGLGLLAYSFFIGTSYAFVAESAADYEQIWENMPEGLREAFGGDIDIASVPGYYSSQLGSYLPVLLGLFLLATATKRLAGAEESGLLDHLLARPVTRKRHLSALTVALLATAGLVFLGLLTGTLTGFLIGGVSPADLGRLTLAVLDAVPITVFFLGLGLLLGAGFHRRGPAYAVGIGIALGLYALEIVAKVVDELEWMSYATPYGYYSRSDLFNGHPDALYWFLLPLSAGAMGVVALRVFDGKDLKG